MDVSDTDVIYLEGNGMVEEVDVSAVDEFTAPPGTTAFKEFPSQASSSFKIYGHSDDLIEVEGDVNLEFYADYDSPTELKVNGMSVYVEYDGDWHIDVLFCPFEVKCAKAEAGTTHDYSDVLHVWTKDEPEVEKVGE